MVPVSIFTKIINREVPATIVAETDELIVIKDLHPKAPIHLLIISKKAVKDIPSMTSEDLRLGEAVFAMAQQLSREIPGAQEFKLVMNNGYTAGQRVFHMHVHFLAGEELAGLV